MDRSPGSHDALDLIGGIYDAVIDPARWHDALNAICGRYRFYLALLDLVDTAQLKSLLHVEVNVAPAFQGMMTPRHIAAVEQLWGGAARMLALPLEEPMTYSKLTDPATWPGNLYYEEFVKPQGIIDAAVLYLVREGPLIGGVGFSRHQSAGPVKTDELDALRVLAPHLRRAVTISGLLRSATTAVATFEAALDASTSGAVLVDSKMRIVHANKAAKRMIAADDPIGDRHGLLEIHGERRPGAVVAAVSGAAHEESLGRRGIAIPVLRADGTPLIVTVMPLVRRSHGTGAPVAASAAVFIAEAHEPLVSAGAASELFGLTPMETRVFELIAAGSTTDDAARTLGVAASTLRTHVLHLFDKTGGAAGRASSSWRAKSGCPDSGVAPPGRNAASRLQGVRDACGLMAHAKSRKVLENQGAYPPFGGGGDRATDLSSPAAGSPLS